MICDCDSCHLAEFLQFLYLKEIIWGDRSRRFCRYDFPRCRMDTTFSTFINLVIFHQPGDFSKVLLKQSFPDFVSQPTSNFNKVYLESWQKKTPQSNHSDENSLSLSISM